MTDRVARIAIIWALALATFWVGERFVRTWLLVADEPRAVVPRGDLANFERVAADVFDNVAPSVVYIFTEMEAAGRFGPVTQQSGTGSGFMWDGAGHVVTNFHVIRNADKIRVRLGSEEPTSASVVGVAPDYDLAVLKVTAGPAGLKAVPIGSSGDLRIGQSVFAIGNPFGLNRSLSTGVVSALNRHLPTASGREVHGVIQTDAAINPGNSGGPLLDSAGRMIGVSTAILSRSGTSSGVGFAIPIDVVNQVVPRLIRDGKFPRPGIGIVIVNEETSARIGVAGIVIAEVFPGSSAAGADLKGVDRRRGQLGDVITEVNGRPVQTIAEFAAVLDEAGIGSEVELTVVRDSWERTVKLEVMDIS